MFFIINMYGKKVLILGVFFVSCGVKIDSLGLRLVKISKGVLSFVMDVVEERGICEWVLYSKFLVKICRFINVLEIEFW